MDIATKLAYAKQHADTIASHDDADVADVRAALTELRDHADSKLATLDADRLARRPPEPEPVAEVTTCTSGDSA